jgi:hypothetical protein
MMQFKEFRQDWRGSPPDHNYHFINWTSTYAKPRYPIIINFEFID